MDLATWREVDGGEEAQRRENRKAVLPLAVQAEGIVPAAYPGTASRTSDVGLPLSPRPSPGITAKPLTCSNERRCLNGARSPGPTFLCNLTSHDTALTVSRSQCENSPTDVSTVCGQFCTSLTGVCLPLSPAPFEQFLTQCNPKCRAFSVSFYFETLSLPLFFHVSESSLQISKFAYVKKIIIQTHCSARCVKA